jgi:hypothetical protein
MRDQKRETQNTFFRPHLWPSHTSREDNPAKRQNDYKKHERQNQAHSGTLGRFMMQSPVLTENLSSRQK